MSATIEARPESLPDNADIWSSYNTTTDGFLVLGYFNDVGVASGMIDAAIGRIKEIRLNVLKDLGNWVILSEVKFEVLRPMTAPGMIQND